ncbi:unnamed protein product [Caenorhabditis sp. 36 PRJEB53466]|nr:unnamed protein product [Caenorhabditis sp. 36 PRJEB53466]
MSSLLILLSLLCVGVVVSAEHRLLVSCKDDSECLSPLTCREGRCVFTRPKQPRTFYAHVGHASERPSFGKACSTGADCDSVSQCVDGECEVMNGSGGACSSDAFCPDGYICVSGKCKKFDKIRFSDFYGPL